MLNASKAFRSSNFDERKSAIDTIVIHSTHCDKAGCFAIFCEQEEPKVSAHYVIDLDGAIYAVVDEEKRAWHAGASYWRGRTDINSCSIGIELVDTLDGKRLTYFPSEQINSLILLCQDIVHRYNVLPCNIVAHSDIAPDRKDDPGRHFDWQYLASRGVGTFPTLEALPNDQAVLIRPKDRGASVRAIRKMLSGCGYKLDVTDEFDEDMRAVVQAFKLRYRQQDADHSAITHGCFAMLCAMFVSGEAQ